MERMSRKFSKAREADERMKKFLSEPLLSNKRTSMKPPRKTKRKRRR
jgi:hypothetical protein